MVGWRDSDVGRVGLVAGVVMTGGEILGTHVL